VGPHCKRVVQQYQVHGGNVIFINKMKRILAATALTRRFLCDPYLNR
jgi:hypothetical protein